MCYYWAVQRAHTGPPRLPLQLLASCHELWWRSTFPEEDSERPAVFHLEPSGSTFLLNNGLVYGQRGPHFLLPYRTLLALCWHEKETEMKKTKQNPSTHPSIYVYIYIYIYISIYVYI